MKKAVLVLENGSIYEGCSSGIKGERIGWVTFYTGVVGYQEVMTNPANAGKIVLMTYPLIGNYGVAQKFMESKGCWIEGMVIKEVSRITSNWQAEGNFKDFLKDNKVMAVSGIDTRALMVELRESGEQFGIISTRDTDPKSLKRKIAKAKVGDLDVIKKISVKKVTKAKGRGLSVAILDIGVTHNLYSQLNNLGCKVTLIPYNSGYKEIMRLSAKGLIISDGPEMDKGLFGVVRTVKRLCGKIPILGIGTGCQVLAMARGARLKKMHSGHHGVNYPILKPRSLKGEISVQNHSYVIEGSSLKKGHLQITWYNINDKTVEGIENRKIKAVGVQFSPVSPGLGEVSPILKEFISSIKRKS